MPRLSVIGTGPAMKGTSITSDLDGGDVIVE
jgi:hypothetical protein